MKITFYGHACFEIESEEIHALIDPFIKENPLCPVDVSDIKNVSHIFATHGHDDHLGDTVEIAKRDNSIIVCNFDMAQTLSQYYNKIHPMSIGGRVQMGFGKVKMTNALHGSYITDHYGQLIYGGTPCGFVIEVEGKKVYHAGDTGLTMDMKLLADENIDVAILPIGGNFTMDIEDAVKAVSFIRPKMAIPMHYKTFDLIDVDPKEFEQSVKGCKVKIMDLGESINI